MAFVYVYIVDRDPVSLLVEDVPSLHPSTYRRRYLISTHCTNNTGKMQHVYKLTKCIWKTKMSWLPSVEIVHAMATNNQCCTVLGTQPVCCLLYYFQTHCRQEMEHWRQQHTSIYTISASNKNIICKWIFYNNNRTKQIKTYHSCKLPLFPKEP